MKVAYFILNNFEYDSRARLEVETIGGLGYDIDLIVTEGGDSDNFMGYPFYRIPQYNWPSRKIRFIQYNIAAARIGAKLKADIYHAVDLDVLAAAYLASRKAGGKLIYEARELYTELEPLWGRPTIKKVWETLERKIIGKADTVFTINESISTELSRRYGIDRPEFIRNVARTPSNLKPVDLRAKYPISSKSRIIVYQGVLRDGQGLLYQLEILRYLSDIVLVCFGSGPIEERIQERIVELGIENKVILAGSVPPDDLLNYTAGADAGILLMEGKALNNRLALPQKLFQYLSAGIPQIVSKMPEISGFVLKEDTGIAVEMEDPERDAEAISKFFNDQIAYGRARRNCVESGARNNWETESEKLVKLYKGLE